LKLRLPRVYGRGNVKRKKTVNFKKNKKATRKKIFAREETKRGKMLSLRNPALTMSLELL